MYVMIDNEQHTMKAKVIKRVYRKKHPYYSGKYSSKTEYELFIDGELKYDSRRRRPFKNIYEFKKSMKKRFDITEFEVIKGRTYNG